MSEVTSVVPRPLLFESLEAPLAPLEALPRSLWLGGITHSRGDLNSRLGALGKWRTALFAGDDTADVACAWPGGKLAHKLCATMHDLDLPRYCVGSVALADTVVQSLLFHLDLVVDHVDRGATEDEAAAIALDAFALDWSDRCGAIDALVEVFGESNDLLKNCRWDMLRGLLRSDDWPESLRIARLIGQLPELAAIIRGLGRARQVDDVDRQDRSHTATLAPTALVTVRSAAIHVPELPGQTRGVYRSGRVSRMLPGEAMMLAHPRLRLVWHARHAERALLSYEDDDRMFETRPHKGEGWSPTPEPSPRCVMGPMLICVDTSGSMRGGAESVAKAVVLEAARVAHSQQRACHVFAFGGPDEIVELTLSHDEHGVSQLVGFLGQAFRGGTDICGPLMRVLERLNESDWQLADLLIASDGEFGATAALGQELDRARSGAGLRVQGVLIGDRETIGLLELADDIFWVRNWRRYGGLDVDSPVHSSRLTATYFPGALRSRENREATVSGAQASQAVRRGGRESLPRKSDR